MNTQFRKWVGLISGIMFLAIALFTAKLSNESFKILDHTALGENSKRVLHVFRGQIELIMTKVKDWGNWDDPYLFVTGRNPDHIATNITPLALQTNKLDRIAYLNEKLEIIYSGQRSGVGADEKLIPWPKDDLKLLDRSTDLIVNSVENVVWQFLELSDGPAMIFARAITDSNGTAPLKGRMVFVSKLGAEFATIVGTQTLLPVEIILQKTLPPQSEIEEIITSKDFSSEIFIYKYSATTFFPLTDKNGKQVAYLKMEQPRTTAIFGRKEVAKSLVFHLISIILVVIGITYAVKASELKSHLLGAIEGKRLVEEREMYLSALLQAIPGSIWWFDSEFICEGNKIDSGQSSGIKQSQFVGVKLDDLENVFPLDTIKAIKYFFESTDSDAQFEYDSHLEHQPKRYLLSLAKYDSDKKVLLVRLDITEQWLTKQQAERDRQQMVHSAHLSSLGEMAGGIAHEINNPLAIIGLAARGLRRAIKNQNEDPAIEKPLSSIEMTVKRAVAIIKGLQNFSRDGSRDPVSYFKVKDLVNETLGLCSERLKNSGVKFEFICTSSDDIEVPCRGVQIGQVLINLINNAFDAVENMPDRWIRLEIIESEENITFQLTDSGHGIPPEVVEKMMNPFYTTKEIGKGTGLGLSVSNSIVESHGGTLKYNAECTNTQMAMVLPRRPHLATGKTNVA